MTEMKGLKKTLRRLERIPHEVKREIPKNLFEIGNDLVALQRSWAPKDTGNLRDEHKFKVEGNLLRLTVYVDVFYASFKEFGTRLHSAQPWFFNAYRARRRRIKLKITRAINKGVKRAIK